MRGYIFTPVERKAIDSFLTGKITVSDKSIRMIRSRIRNFSELSADVKLYMRLRKAIAT
jgi:hypothetical protein